jgi:hypothetical protein
VGRRDVLIPDHTLALHGEARLDRLHIEIERDKSIVDLHHQVGSKHAI